MLTRLLIGTIWTHYIFIYMWGVCMHHFLYVYQVFQFYENIREVNR